MKNKICILVSTLCVALLFNACSKALSENSISESRSSEISVSESSIAAPSISESSSVKESHAESLNPEPSESREERALSSTFSTSEMTDVKTPAATNPFEVGKDEIYDLYLFYPDRLTYRMLGGYFWSPREEADNHAIVLALNALPPLPKLDTTPNAKVQTGFLIIREDYKKTQINLLEHALEVDGTYYSLTEEQYDKLKKLADEVTELGSSFGQSPQWLIWMNPNRVTNIECTDETGRTFKLKQENFLLAAMEPSFLSASSGRSYKPGSNNFNEMKDAFKTVFTFDNGGTYTMVLAENKLYLESSDMDIACQYQIWPNSADSFVSSMKNAETGMMNPRTGKPVIYLYPEKTQDVSVKLNFRGELYYTYPTYNGGWNVTAAPDGTLTNKADGSTHYYLFWDGNSNFRDWDFSEGFIVKGDEVENFFKDKLPAMGLTPREYNDFITYWTPELSRNKYNLVTFSTAQYEAIAPLDITPTPDTILRVHMVYKSISEPIAVKEQVLPKAPGRSGFMVVEWGGTRAD